jgi:hypothetical protein
MPKNRLMAGTFHLAPLHVSMTEGAKTELGVVPSVESFLLYHVRKLRSGGTELEWLRPNGLGFSRRLPALANATDCRAGSNFQTPNRPDLVRRQAVGYNPLFGAHADSSILMLRSWFSCCWC